MSALSSSSHLLEMLYGRLSTRPALGEVGANCGNELPASQYSAAVSDHKLVQDSNLDVESVPISISSFA